MVKAGRIFLSGGQLMRSTGCMIMWYQRMDSFWEQTLEDFNKHFGGNRTAIAIRNNWSRIVVVSDEDMGSSQ